MKDLKADPISIDPEPSSYRFGIQEVWEYRNQLFLLVGRTLKIRYKQTAAGAAWAVIQPLITMVVLSIFFGKLAKVPTEGIPYPLFSFSALVPWTYFATVLTQSSTSIVSNRDLVTKLYIPRLIIPLTPVLSNLIDFIIAFVILIVIMLFYGIYPNAAIIYLPFFILLTIATALSFGLFLSVINVRYRDIGFMLPFIIQIWFFISPIAYASSLVPSKWQFVYGLNPMVGVIEGFRWALIGKTQAPGTVIFTSTIIVILILIFGIGFFLRKETTFPDHL